MENELEYLRIFLKEYLTRKYSFHVDEFTINYKNEVDDYYSIEYEEKPLIETYDCIEINQESQIILVHHQGKIANHLKVMGARCASYTSEQIKVREPEVFTLEQFKTTEYFKKMMEKISMTYDDILKKGKELYEKWENTINESVKYNSQYKMRKCFETKDDYIYLEVDFLNNKVNIDSQSFNTYYLTDMNSIQIVDSEEQEKLEEKSNNYDKLLSLVNDNKIHKINNGYIIDNNYYKTIEEYLEEN